MNVKHMNPTAVATFRVKPAGEKEAETVSFTVRLLGIHEIPDYVPKPEKGKSLRQSKVITEALIDAVQGWDLTLDNQPLECNEENKREWLPYLLGLRVIKDGEEPDAKLSMDNILGMALLGFAGDAENFIKN